MASFLEFFYTSSYLYLLVCTCNWSTYTKFRALDRVVGFETAFGASLVDASTYDLGG
jgi:hypothetical protein